MKIKGRLRGAVSKLLRRPAPAAARGADSSSECFSKLLPLARVVSFDVFDTVLLRKTRCPTDVFLYMESEARNILANPGARFPELRIQSETIARQRAFTQHGYDDTNLEEIYSVLRELTGIGDDALRALLELELRCEERLIYANPYAARLCKLVEAQGKTLAFTSDMYLPRFAVAHLLETNGFCAQNLLISSETRVTKHGGKLFDLLVGRFGGDPGKILHTGDNEWSDFERARQRGLTSLHWQPQPEQLPFVDQIASCAPDWDRDLSSSIYAGLARKRRLSHPVVGTGASDFWKAIGYEVIGPLYLSFVSWTIKQAQDLDVDKLFFLARDGYYLIKVFDILKERWKFAINADYLYASRRLLNVPRITSIDEEALSFLTEPNPWMSLGDFLERIGLDPALYCERLCDFGFTSPDQLLTSAQGFVSEKVRENTRALIKSLGGDILALAARERSRLLSYFSDISLTPGKAALVDIGWQASSIRSLRDLLNLSGNEPGLHGLYFSTWRFAESVLLSGCPLRSFYVHLDRPRHRAHLICEGVELLEAFFCAPHPSVVGLKKSNGRWRPLYGEKELGDTQQRNLDVAKEAALEFVVEATDLARDCDFGQPPFAYLDTVLERILGHPLPHEARILGELSHRNSFGGSALPRHIAKAPAKEKRENVATLREAYERSYWKTGFLAQLTGKEKRLLKREQRVRWDAYDNAYHFWKEYKRKRLSRHEAVKIIDDRYGLRLFIALYPLYKIVKPFKKLMKFFKKMA
ncbi:MAG: hypothetical protein P4L43_09295 [Syntrophobacteraceae bacterium]|nr:hypothetical protein [Syntrophobacteraceae bacterium]